MGAKDLRQNSGQCGHLIVKHRGLAERSSREEKMEGLIIKSCKLVGLAGAVLALSLMAGCSSNEPTPEQRAVNAANRADQAASRAQAASQTAQQAAASSQAAAARVTQAAADAKAAADRAEAIAARTMATPRARKLGLYRHHHKAAAEAAPSGGDSGAPAAAPSP